MKRLWKLLFALLGAVGGFYGGAFLCQDILFRMGFKEPMIIAVFVGTILLGALVGFLLTKPIMTICYKMTSMVENKLQKMPITDLLGGAIGLIIGLIIATFIGYALARIPLVGSVLAIAIVVIVGYLGMSIGARKHYEILNLPNTLKRERQRMRKGTCPESEDGNMCNRPKVLDTSVIIDGRILDICQTGFVEGPLVIPNFVLEELRHIADSADSLKRIRGRRGLDILDKIRRELSIEVQIAVEDYPDIAEVDDKLLRLAQDMCGCVVTNDFNLNKVAKLQGVTVLNINELANALKPVSLPGEEMRITIVKEGKEYNQGVAYLDDGTMIVVENGREHMNEVVDVMVTSVIQTNAGRMIFAKIDEKENRD